MIFDHHRTTQVLFNDTIEYNIRYAKTDATHEEVGGCSGALRICSCADVERRVLCMRPGLGPVGPPTAATRIPFLLPPPACANTTSTAAPAAAPVHARRVQVVEAAQAACIHDVIASRFPLKYDTVVGERGLRLRCVAPCVWWWGCSSVRCNSFNTPMCMSCSAFPDACIPAPLRAAAARSSAWHLPAPSSRTRRS